MSQIASLCFQHSPYILNVKAKVYSTFHSGLSNDELISKEITNLANLLFKCFWSMSCRLHLLSFKGLYNRLTKEETIEKAQDFNSTSIAIFDYSKLVANTINGQNMNKQLFSFSEEMGQNTLEATWKRTRDIAETFCKYIEDLKTTTQENKQELKEKILKRVEELS
jgi:hypothetical protein